MVFLPLFPDLYRITSFKSDRGIVRMPAVMPVVMPLPFNEECYRKGYFVPSSYVYQILFIEGSFVTVTVAGQFYCGSAFADC